MNPYFGLFSESSADVLSYVSDLEGRIIAVERAKWSEFSAQNGAAHLTDGAGLNIFACCSDIETASAYQIIHFALQSHALDHYSFSFRCDSPDRTRLFHMTMSWYPGCQPNGAILYRSKLLMECSRTAVSLLSLEAQRRRSATHIVKLCSFCQHAWDTASNSWLEAQDHPSAHAQDVRTMHGICGDCRDRIVMPVLSYLGQSSSLPT